MKKGDICFIFVIFFILFSAGYAISAPSIDFVDPTPDNITNINLRFNSSMEINASITESSLGEIIFNWKSVNYTFYNNSLLLMMNFDNVSALGENDTMIVDSSRYGNNGTGNATWNSTGKYGGAFEFDGVYDYIYKTVSAGGSLNFNNSFSYTLWFKTGNNGVSQGIMGKTTDDATTGTSAFLKFRHFLLLSRLLWEYASEKEREKFTLHSR